MRNRYRFMPLFSPEGAGGGGAADAGAGGGDPAAAAAAAASAAAAPPELYRPQGLPDHLVGATNQETIDKLYGAYTPLREDMAKRGAVPKDPKEYVFEPSDRLKPFFDNADDPVMNQFRQVAQKIGIPTGQFSAILEETFGPLVESGVLGPTYDPQAELAQLGKLIQAPDGPAGKTAIAAAANEATSFAEGLGAHLKLGDEAKGAVLALADTASGIVALRAIKGMLGERGIQLGGESGGQGWTKERLKSMVGDERIDPYSPKFDKTLRAEYDAAYQRLYPGGG
ncbi:hypothetical protein [Kaistia sp. MMO-174]|uniref:hypothetical protein n=1 Tax=Kaistia sp. MMO-174 TaxID=3081256 RepID=UPI003015D0E2